MTAHMLYSVFSVQCSVSRQKSHKSHWLNICFSIIIMLVIISICVMFKARLLSLLSKIAYTSSFSNVIVMLCDKGVVDCFTMQSAHLIMILHM